MTKLKKVMIADDDPGILDAVEAMLEFGGYDVSTTSNGATLLEMKEGFPDLLLLDIWMSGIDGRDVCRGLKSDPATGSIPVLMISASRDIRESALASGANDFLAKPFDMDELLDRIDKLIS